MSLERSRTSSYWRSIVIMTVPCINSKIKRDIDRKLRFLCRHSTPPLRDLRRNIAITLGMEKLEWYHSPVKKFDDMSSCFDAVPACDGQRDGQTDVLRQHSQRYAYASRGENDGPPPKYCREVSWIRSRRVFMFKSETV